jgi:type II secretory pathway component GspD/PulD (secretin)
VDQQRERSNTGVPGLKDIPGIGLLFRSSQRRQTTTELFLFLTPHVIRTDAEFEETSRRLRQGSEVERATGGRVPIASPRDSTPR